MIIIPKTDIRTENLSLKKLNSILWSDNVKLNNEIREKDKKIERQRKELHRLNKIIEGEKK